MRVIPFIHHSIIGSFFVMLFGIIAGPVNLLAQEYETTARQAYLVDFDTGTVLFEKAASTPMFPASMTKIMTVFVAFERLREGSLSLEDMFRISEKAWRKGGSKMFVEVDTEVSVDDLLRGIIIQSGNDASIALAEGIAGSETAFATLMTDKAAEIGMNNTIFVNATGWPDENHVTTARDLALLAATTIREFPEYYSLFSLPDFTYSDIEQSNRNPLLYLDIGADGLKTGHTEISGYGLTASAVQGDRRLVMVINGLASERERVEESARLMSWGFANFKNYELLKANEVVDAAAVWMGRDERVPLVLQDDLMVSMSRSARSALEVSVHYQGPVAAPIAAGAEIATLRVKAPGMETVERPLFAATAVERLGFLSRQFARLNAFLFGSINELGEG